MNYGLGSSAAFGVEAAPMRYPRLWGWITVVFLAALWIWAFIISPSAAALTFIGLLTVAVYLWLLVRLSYFPPRRR